MRRTLNILQACPLHRYIPVTYALSWHGRLSTIGITINLENYENLRLEVQGEVGDDGNTEDLISFLDGMLARLGHGDQVTAERVEAYRRRVLAAPESAVVAAVPRLAGFRGRKRLAVRSATAGTKPGAASQTPLNRYRRRRRPGRKPRPRR